MSILYIEKMINKCMMNNLISDFNTLTNKQFTLDLNS